MKKAIVFGGGGFIGNHLVKHLKSNDFKVTAVDLHLPLFEKSQADEFILGDLREKDFCQQFASVKWDEIYQLAADMGGAGYIFTGKNDADILHSSALINLNILDSFKNHTKSKIFFSSSACVYPMHNQNSIIAPNCSEDSVYPANPDSDYGWEKLFSERMYLAYSRNYNLNIRIGRFHNVYGPGNLYEGGREKAPSAICRKVALAKENDSIEIWGDGLQTRSFLFIDDCMHAVRLLMNSTYSHPINIGSEEMISINELAQMIIRVSGKNLTINNIDGPQGVRGRVSDNQLIKTTLAWQPTVHLSKGLTAMYYWIEEQINIV